MSRRLLAALALIGALAGCSGRSCDDLPRLRAERDVARADYLDLVRSGTATSQVTEEADEQLHAVERRVHAAEQGCAGR